jgi:uncharacterized iron-regulated protein
MNSYLNYISFLGIFIFFILSTFAQDKPAYQLFDAQGGSVTYAEILDSVKKGDVLFIGELHNDPIVHWLQLQLTKDLYTEKGDRLVLGAEMFEADDQPILNEYLNDLIDTKRFNKEAKLWPNYDTDYAPLVDFAKQNSIPFIATNVPRRYASIVYDKGLDYLDSLDEQTHQWMAPLPIEVNMELESYKQMKKMGEGHGNPNLPYSQALKDATMAYFIQDNWEEGDFFIHYNGTYHSKDHEGIVWYLHQYEPDVQAYTIATVHQTSVDTLIEDNKGVADYIIVTPYDMTKTH